MNRLQLAFSTLKHPKCIMKEKVSVISMSELLKLSMANFIWSLEEIPLLAWEYLKWTCSTWTWIVWDQVSALHTLFPSRAQTLPRFLNTDHIYLAQFIPIQPCEHSNPFARTYNHTNDGSGINSPQVFLWLVTLDLSYERTGEINYLDQTINCHLIKLIPPCNSHWAASLTTALYIHNRKKYGGLFTVVLSVLLRTKSQCVQHGYSLVREHMIAAYELHAMYMNYMKTGNTSPWLCGLI